MIDLLLTPDNAAAFGRIISPGVKSIIDHAVSAWASSALELEEARAKNDARLLHLEEELADAFDKARTARLVDMAEELMPKIEEFVEGYFGEGVPSGLSPIPGVPTVDDLEALYDLLGLCGRLADLDTLRGWSAGQRLMAEEWAAAVHLAASDHGEVSIPPEPWFVQRLFRAESGYTDGQIVSVNATGSLARVVESRLGVDGWLTVAFLDTDNLMAVAPHEITPHKPASTPDA